MVGLTVVASILATLPLVLILGLLIQKGASSLSWDFFTAMPKPVGETGGGMANAMLGTVMLIAIASSISLSCGTTRFTRWSSRASEALMSSPKNMSSLALASPTVLGMK